MNGKNVELLGANASQDGLSVVSKRTDKHQISDALKKVLKKSSCVLAGLNYLVNRTECFGRINLSKGVYNFAHKFIVGEAQQVYRTLIGHLFGVAASDQLVKQ